MFLQSSASLVAAVVAVFIGVSGSADAFLPSVGVRPPALVLQTKHSFFSLPATAKNVSHAHVEDYRDQLSRSRKPANGDANGDGSESVVRRARGGVLWFLGRLIGCAFPFSLNHAAHHISIEYGCRDEVWWILISELRTNRPRRPTHQESVAVGLSTESRGLLGHGENHQLAARRR